MTIGNECECSFILPHVRLPMSQLSASRCRHETNQGIWEYFFVFFLRWDWLYLFWLLKSDLRNLVIVSLENSVFFSFFFYSAFSSLSFLQYVLIEEVETGVIVKHCLGQGWQIFLKWYKSRWVSDLFFAI